MPTKYQYSLWLDGKLYFCKEYYVVILHLHPYVASVFNATQRGIPLSLEFFQWKTHVEPRRSARKVLRPKV